MVGQNVIRLVRIESLFWMDERVLRMFGVFCISHVYAVLFFNKSVAPSVGPPYDPSSPIITLCRSPTMRFWFYCICMRLCFFLSLSRFHSFPLLLKFIGERQKLFCNPVAQIRSLTSHTVLMEFEIYSWIVTIFVHWIVQLKPWAICFFFPQKMAPVSL